VALEMVFVFLCVARACRQGLAGGITVVYATGAGAIGIHSHSVLNKLLRSVSLKTLVGVSEILGHTVEDRTAIAAQQDPELVHHLQASSTVPVSSHGSILHDLWVL
jgi:hypothetical protein